MMTSLTQIIAAIPSKLVKILFADVVRMNVKPWLKHSSRKNVNYTNGLIVVSAWEMLIIIAVISSLKKTLDYELHSQLPIIVLSIILLFTNEKVVVDRWARGVNLGDYVSSQSRSLWLIRVGYFLITILSILLLVAFSGDK